MHKLKVITGNIDKSEFPLISGQNRIGRSSECEICLPSSHVSRVHAIITIKENIITIADQGSANGTYVNDKKIKEIELTKGDVITMGDFIFKYSYEIKKAREPLLERDPASDHIFAGEERKHEEPSAPKKKSLLVELIAKFNILEWKVRIIIFLGIYILFSYFLVTEFLIKKSAEEIFSESYNKAKVLVKYLAERNREELYLNNDLLLDVESILNEEGILEAYIIDNKFRVRAPTNKINQIANDFITKEALNEDKIIDNFPKLEQISGLIDDKKTDTQFILAYPIRVWEEMQGKYRNIGVAKIVFNPKAVIAGHLNTKELRKKGLILAIIPGIIIFILIVLTTVAPLKKIREGIEAVLKGEKKEVPSPLSFSELRKLVDIINRGLTKHSFSASYLNPSSETESSNLGISKEDSEDHHEKINFIINAVEDGIIIANANNKILEANHKAKELLKLPDNAGVGMHILEAIPDKSVLAGINELIKELESKSAEDIPSRDVEYGGPSMRLRIRASAKREHFRKIDSIVFVFKYL